LATAVLTQGGSRELELHSIKLKEAETEFRTHYDILRVELGAKYGKPFPTIEETASDPGEDSKEEVAKTEEKKEKTDASSSTDPAKRSELREWTDASGKHKIKAKCVGVEKGVVKLQKTDGAVISVPLASLCEADRQFLGESK